MFWLGLFIGANIGLFIAVLILAARKNHDAENRPEIPPQ